MPEISPALYRAGEGPPVVLLHGFSGTWRHWRPVLADLEIPGAEFVVLEGTGFAARHAAAPAITA